MMRRARWLAAGAVLGAVGFQRLQRAARSQTSQLDQGSSARQAATVLGIAASAAGHSAGWLARQVRHRRSAGRKPAGVAGFLSDVRVGMDEYLDRHQANIDRQHPRAGNTLIAQRVSDRAAIPGRPEAASAGRRDDE
jgi:hypothetical protein